MDYSIDIRFVGLCCFARPLHSDEPYKRRVLLPADRRCGHIAFLEIAKDDLVSLPSGNLKPSEPYCHLVSNPSGGRPVSGSVLYVMWKLAGHFIEFKNAKLDVPFQVATSFTRHIPAMHKNVATSLHQHPQSSCFSDDPPTDVIAGAIDIPSGTLSVSDVEEVMLHFETEKTHIKSAYGPAQSPKYALLNLPLREESAEFHLRSFPSAGKPTCAVIRVKPGAVVRIGNALEVDIKGPGSPGLHPEHFRLFYNLSDKEHCPKDLPLPKCERVPLNACSPTDWP